MFVKRGKRELRGITPSQTTKKLKRTLLSAYFTTLASLVVCCAMFLGTTMAWFSSDVTNTGNVIQVGSLTAGVFRVEQTEQLDLTDSANRAFVFAKPWQPKGAAVETFKVVNAGSLPFVYEVDLLVAPNSATKPAADGTRVPLTAEETAVLLSCFEVYIINGEASFDDLKAFVEGQPGAAVWTPITVTVSGPSVKATLLELTTEPSAGSENADVILYSGQLDVKQAGQQESYEKFTVGIYMKENITAEVMGWNMELIMQLTADQLTSGH